MSWTAPRTNPTGSGLLTHAVINTVIFILRKSTGERMLPESFEHREQWQGFDKDTTVFQPIYFIAGFFRIQRDDETTEVSEVMSPKSLHTEGESPPPTVINVSGEK